MSADSRHLSAEQVDGYGRRTLTPDDLLEVSDHLAACEACRGRLAAPGALDDAVAARRAELQAALDTLDHPSPDDIGRFIEDALEEVDREVMVSHLESCQMCWEDADDLRRVRRDMAVVREPPGAGRSRSWRGRQGYAASIALAAGLAGFVVWTTVRSKPTPDTASSSGAGPPQPPSAAASAPAEVLTIRDGGGSVTLLGDGSTRGLPATLAPELAAGIARALREGRLEVSPLVDSLAVAAGTLMSGARDETPFEPLRPLSTAVDSDRPMLEWTPLAGATSYLVSVFDLEFRKVAESPRITGTSWRLAAPLPRGHTYIWQVRGWRSEGDVIVVPSPPAPEARFRVLPQADADRLLDARNRHGESALAMSVLLAQAGVLDEAELELQKLTETNPDASVLQNMSNELRNHRRRLPQPPSGVDAGQRK